MSDPDNLTLTPTSLPIISADSALDLRPLTPARVALGRTGVSLPTRHALEFSLAQAQARDAVHSTLAVASLMESLSRRKLAALSVRSAASTRTEYLRRPDLGRKLSEASATLLATASNARSGVSNAMPAHTAEVRRTPATLSLVLADGLSALATDRHVLPLLDALLPLLDDTWQLAPIVIAEQARVALADEIGVALHADVAVIFIGERPGVSSPDSLGAYITWAPRAGRTDAERNCVSNIRGEGLDHATAAAKIAWYVTEGRRLGLTGVNLRERDESSLPSAIGPVPSRVGP